MNKEEVNAVPFKFSTHLSLEHKHCTTYTAEYGGHMFGMKDWVPKGRAYIHYMVDGKVFLTLQKFYEFCETI